MFYTLRTAGDLHGKMVKPLLCVHEVTGSNLVHKSIFQRYDLWESSLELEVSYSKQCSYQRTC